jgi:hypothetical protein
MRGVQHDALAAAIALRPGHPDPATRAEPPAEHRRPMTAKIAVRNPQPRSDLAGDELTHLGTQRLAFGRQLDRIEMEGSTHRPLTINLASPSLQPTAKKFGDDPQLPCRQTKTR